MRLLGVELDRFRSRRAVVLLLLAAALLTALLAGTALWDTRPVSDQERARAEAQAQLAADDPQLQEDLADCRENPADFFGPDTVAAQCDNFMVPRVEDYLGRAELDLRSRRGRAGRGADRDPAALLIIVGATFAGCRLADRLDGQPAALRAAPAPGLAGEGAPRPGRRSRRGRRCSSAPSGSCSPWSPTRGDSAPSADVLRDIRLTAVRGTLLAGGAALGGYALTMLLRRTVATLAVLFAYAVGGEALVASLPMDRAGDWSLANNVLAWLHDGTRCSTTASAARRAWTVRPVLPARSGTGRRTWRCCCWPPWSSRCWRSGAATCPDRRDSSRRVQLVR